ncbi:MAG TPA: hypothetical protein VL989_03965 [Candidatus Sulfotelmatobacter sp.]|nr:hypothetical protein [Candidatus Sulfotelmatobacter sp.]
MVKHNQDGAANTAVMLGIFIVLFVAAVVFGVYSYSKMLDYKNNTDAKIAVAVNLAINKQKLIDANSYAQEAKNPLATYYGPSQYGSIVVQYPKTWSAYVDDTSSQSALLDGYFKPGYVPSISDQNSTFALRVQVLSQTYSQTLQQYSTQEQSGQLTASAYALPKVPKTIGVKLVGELQNGSNPVNTTMVVLPLFSDTLLIWTQGTQYLNDFNTYVLPNFSFSP